MRMEHASSDPDAGEEEKMMMETPAIRINLAKKLKRILKYWIHLCPITP